VTTTHDENDARDPPTPTTIAIPIRRRPRRRGLGESSPSALPSAFCATTTGEALVLAYTFVAAMNVRARSTINMYGRMRKRFIRTSIDYDEVSKHRTISADGAPHRYGFDYKTAHE
jgi:hypothetical protein